MIHYSVGSGYYFTMKGPMALDQEFIDKVKAQMHRIVDENLPIVKRSVSTSEAVALFHKHHMYDKEKLFNYRRSSAVNLYSIGSFEDYFYGFMANHTGYIKTFDLFLYEGGFVLQLPTQNEPDRIPEFKPREKIFRVQKESQEWGDKLDIATVGDLNEKVTRGGIQDILLIQEAMQEAKISEIASEIAAAGNKKFVMIAGPSSSGKTTFSHRLSIQLAAHGMKPHPIAVDNYFVERVLREIPQGRLNGHPHKRLPGNVNFSFEGIDATSLLVLLEEDGICASAGSACNTGQTRISHVIEAIHVPKNYAPGSVRFTMGRETDRRQVDAVIASLKKNIGLLRGE